MNRRYRHWIVLLLGAAALSAAAEVGLRVRYRCRVLSKLGASEPGIVRIVALGDSIVAGMPGPTPEAWPTVLAECLRANYPAVVWRVVNAGVPGDTAPSGYARFDVDVASAGPQLVLIAFGLNDCNPARYGLDRWFEESVPRGLAEQSYLWRAVQVRIKRLGRPVEPQVNPAHLCQARTSPTAFAAALSALVTRTRDVGALPVLLTMTPLASSGTSEAQARIGTYEAYNALTREHAAHRGVPLVELTSPMPAGGFERDGLHLTKAGQAWVATQIYDQLDVGGVWDRLAREAGR
jgi:lysophospholipase L1-like esterase